MIERLHQFPTNRVNADGAFFGQIAELDPPFTSARDGKSLRLKTGRTDIRIGNHVRLFLELLASFVRIDGLAFAGEHEDIALAQRIDQFEIVHIALGWWDDRTCRQLAFFIYFNTPGNLGLRSFFRYKCHDIDEFINITKCAVTIQIPNAKFQTQCARIAERLHPKFAGPGRQANGCQRGVHWRIGEGDPNGIGKTGAATIYGLLILIGRFQPQIGFALGREASICGIDADGFGRRYNG